MNFTTLTPEKLLDLRRHFDIDYGICDFTFGANYMWCDYFKSSYAISSKGVLIIASADEANYSYPIGRGNDRDALTELAEYVSAQNKTFILDRVPCEKIDEILKLFKRGKTDEIPKLWWDYVYEIDALAQMTGKKYNGPRNHINKFVREYPSAVFKLIEENDLSACKEFLSEYVKGHDKSSDSYKHDNRATLRVLDNYSKLGFVGGAVFNEGKVLAFAIGEKLGETLYVQIEKCSKEVPSVSKYLVREFAKMGQRLGVKFVNRAEDLGDEGIRYSKEHYNPIRLEKKYKIII